VAILDHTSTLESVREKVVAGERLDLEDGLLLMESDDVLSVGELADLARRQRGGNDDVYFVQNLYLNQTNVCRVKCKFCAFAVTQKQEGAYTYTAEELVKGDNTFFVATGITDGYLLRGVRYTASGATTQSIVMRSKSGTVRVVESTHVLEKVQRAIEAGRS